MAPNKINKLELTWIGKEDEPLAIEPRLLLDTPEYSFGEVEISTLPNGKPWPGNMLIHGDNLLALRALEQDFTGLIKCIYIDPPYNTGSAFEHYDDNLEHSIWLSLMKSRIEILHKLLHKNGTLWVSLDDNEAHYLKIVGDEIFGRRNFIADVAWEKSDSPKMDSKLFSSRYDHTLIWAKDIDTLQLNGFKPLNVPSHYNKRTASGVPYYLKPLRAMGAADRREDRPTLYFPLLAPDGGIVYPIRTDGSAGRWRWSKEKIELQSDLIEWIKGKNGYTPYFKVLFGETATVPPETIWTFSDAGSNRVSKQEIKILFDSQKNFDTPKPEKLLERIIHVSTKPGDIVLDSFLGSGTTAAVAHKMGRRWIGVELGDHAYTHCAVRMRKVIEGEQGGISKSVNWQGGGGFKFYELAPSLLNHDKYGNLVINKEYNADMLAAAMAKHQGYTYSPDKDVYWKQGYGSEKDFIFTTTQFLTAEALQQLHEQMADDESLLICCTSFQPECRNRYSNITIKKIPQMLLGRCEFDKDDYSLNIVSVPEIEEEEELDEEAMSSSEDKDNKDDKTYNQPTLFD